MDFWTLIKAIAWKVERDDGFIVVHELLTAPQ